MRTKHNCISLLIIAIFYGTLPSVAQDGLFKDLTTKKIKIQDKEFEIQKGYFEIPEDYTTVASRIIKLPVLIVKAGSRNLSEPIFWLDGGPGSYNIPGEKSLKYWGDHDVVYVGYRGADGPSKMRSKKIAKALKGKHHKLLSDESLDNIGTQTRKYLNGLRKSGVDVTKYTMMDVIEDVEYIRKALGYKKVNLISSSYGTRLALLYSYKYPESINRSVMQGANPPGHLVWDPKKVDEFIDRYDSLYSIQNPSAGKGTIKATMITAFKQMPKRWRAFRLDADKIKVATFSSMYTPASAVQVFDAYSNAANKGDYAGLCLIQLGFDMGISSKDLSLGDAILKAMSADYDPNIDYRRLLRSPNTVLGGNVSLLYWGGTKKIEYYHSIPVEYKTLQESKTETLIISGNLDLVTPADYATKELLPYLPNGKQVILRDYSHNAIFKGKEGETVRQMVVKYLETGILDDTNISYKPVNFKPDTSFNKIAKKKYFMLLLAGIIY